MKEDSVAILMSTYNGEKYLKEQIRSIEDQDYKNWHLYIRDDGSDDKTTNIIEEYTKINKNISFINENNRNNIGVVRSFFELLKLVNADYYMFCDQDDFWLKNKISLSVNAMRNVSKNIPVCVHTNFKSVDNNLEKEIGNGHRYVSEKFLDILFSNCVTGCTVMINDALKKMIYFEKLDFSRIHMHDWWLALIASEFGKIIYLDKKTVLYRQHKNNVVGSSGKSGFLNLFLRLIHPSYDINEIKKLSNISLCFYNMYGEQMINEKDYRYISEYKELSKKTTFSNVINLIHKLPPQKKTKSRQLLFDYFLVLYSFSRNRKETLS